MKKLIIGCGYLGHRVALRWLKQGVDVAALTRSAIHAEDFRKLGIDPIIGDVTDVSSLNRLPAVDTLLYAVGYDRSSGQSQREIYIDGLKNVLDIIVSRVGRIIYVSSSSVYGQSQGEWVDETSSTEPIRSNGRVCLDAEELLWKVIPRESKAPAANVLRLAGLYGPGRLLQRAEALKLAKPLDGNPDAFLNLVHIDDAVQSVLACEERGKPGETYLVCDDRPIPRRDYFSLLASLVGAPEPEYEKLSNPSSDTPTLNKRCSNRKLHEALHVDLRYPNITIGLPPALLATE